MKNLARMTRRLKNGIPVPCRLLPWLRGTYRKCDFRVTCRLFSRVVFNRNIRHTAVWQQIEAGRNTCVSLAVMVTLLRRNIVFCDLFRRNLDTTVLLNQLRNL
jgi:hypothetical protein